MPVQRSQFERRPLTPKQTRIWDYVKATPPGSMVIIGYGGAAGGGKTRAIVELAIDLATDYPGNKIVIGRKDYADLRTTTMEQFDLHCPQGLIVGRNEQEHWRDIRLGHWPEGVKSRVIFRELKDYLGMGSEEYGAVLVDEAGEVPVNGVRMALGRLRWKLPDSVMQTRVEDCDRCTATGKVNGRDCMWCRGKGGWPDGKPAKYVFLAASNPIPGWFEQWFVKRSLNEEQLRDLGTNIHFIPALPSDNPFLPDDYEARLRLAWPNDWVKRLMEGRWDAFVGQVFPMFSEDLHCYRGPLPDEKEWVRIIGGLDFGGLNPFDHMTAGICAIQLRSNRIIRVGEFEERGEHVYDRQLAWMLAMEQRWCKRNTGPRIWWVADRSQGVGIERMKQMGFKVFPSKGGWDSVEEGLKMVARRFEVDPTGIPASFYLPDLVKFPERVVAYRYEEPKDDAAPVKRKPVERNDDLLAADRYMHELLEVGYGDPATNQVAVVPPWAPLRTKSRMEDLFTWQT